MDEVEGEVRHARDGAGPHIGQIHARLFAAVLVGIEGADRVVDLVVEEIAVQAEFLGHLAVTQRLEQQLDADGRRGRVLGEGVEEVAIAGNRLQGEVICQLPVDRARNAPALVGVDRGDHHRLPRGFAGHALARVDEGRVAQVRVVRVVRIAGVRTERHELIVVGDTVQGQAVGPGVGDGVGLDRRLVVGRIRREVHFELFIRDPADRDLAGVEGLAAVLAEHAAGADVERRQAGSRMAAGIVEAGDIAFMVPRRGGDADEELVRDNREVGRSSDVDPVVAAVGAFQIAAPLAIRLLGEQLDRAADGVPAGQGALRSAQDFDAVEVGQIEQ